MNPFIKYGGSEKICENEYNYSNRAYVSNPINFVKPIIIFTVVQSTIGMFNLFTEPFILTGQNWQGGINNGGLTLMTYLLSKAPQGGNLYGYASSVAYIISAMIIFISICVNKGTIDKKDPDYLADQAVKKQRKQMAKMSRCKGGKAA